MPDPDPRSVAIRCGAVLDVGRGAIDRDRVIHVDGEGRIAAVGRAADGIPDDATVVDLGEFASYVRAGMIPLAAIRTATTTAAELMGWSDRVGSLAPGRFADLIAVAGDPLADVTELERPLWSRRAAATSAMIDRPDSTGASGSGSAGNRPLDRHGHARRHRRRLSGRVAQRHRWVTPGPARGRSPSG